MNIDWKKAPPMAGECSEGVDAGCDNEDDGTDGKWDKRVRSLAGCHDGRGREICFGPEWTGQDERATGLPGAARRHLDNSD